MDEERASRTAEIAAAFRADHQTQHGGSIFADLDAFRFVGEPWRSLIETPWLRAGLLGNPLLPLAELQATVIVRSRFAEDVLADAYDRGARQYVLIGAGFDSFAIRRAAAFPGMEVFELDHPATQARKREQMPDAAEPHFVPVDFEVESVAEALARSHFDPAAPSVWVWLGVTHYLSHDAVRATLDALASVCRAPVDLVLDYSLPPEDLPLRERVGLRVVDFVTSLWNEPIFGHWSTGELHGHLLESGWRIEADLDAAALSQRYEGAWPVGMRPPLSVRLLHVARGRA